MSIFNESILPKIQEISKAYIKSYNEALKEAFSCFDQFEEELKNGRAAAREKTLENKNVLKTLQSIKENEDEKATEEIKTNDERSSTESGTEKRGSKKRSKNEVDGMSSPEQDKRPKRNASAKAQSIISKQKKIDDSVVFVSSEKKIDDSVVFVSSEVNVSLTQKLRRENSIEKSKNHRRKDDNKENSEPVPAVQIKQEKISCPPEPEQMDMESLPLNIVIKPEPNKDDIAMPPPAIPLARSRKGLQKEKSDVGSGEETRGRTRSKKRADLPPPVASTRSTRSSSRLTKQLDGEESVVAEARPKRTRGKKATPESSTTDSGKDSQSTQDSGIGSPADKPRPKRTRRARKVSEKQQEEPKVSEQTTETLISPKEERLTQPDRGTIIIENSMKVVENGMDGRQNEKEGRQNDIDDKNNDIDGSQNRMDGKQNRMDGKQNIIDVKQNDIDGQQNGKYGKLNDINGKPNNIDDEQNFVDGEQNELNVSENNIDGRDSDVAKKALDKTTVLSKLDATVTISNDLDKSIVLPSGLYNHSDMSKPKTMNETVVIESSSRDTVVLDKHVIMDATVVIEKDPKMTNVTDDNSLLTDDDESVEMRTPPPKKPPSAQPTSAVKEKVQQFEEMASRVTRTKTRALAKKDEPTENQTPPDRVIKPALGPDTLNKMNSLIFNGKIPQVSNSASKLNNVSLMKSQIPTSSSKLSGVTRAREEEARREKEDARRKKEALLEAKREVHKRKREEKMAAAAAARSAAERERQAALAAAARGRHEKQLHADVSKLERLREVERKKLELARKLAETEERRRAEEAARQLRLEDERRRAEDTRRRQLAEAEAMKKEVALMANEFERKQREFLEQQKMKKRLEANKMSTPLKYRMEPVYMEGGFQYLNSDEEASPVRKRDLPAWSTSKNCLLSAAIQDRLKTAQIDKLFSVREQTADLREIFPAIDRSRLKRTSSAVWRTPPGRLAELPE